MNDSTPWLIGNAVGSVPVARAYAHATAAITAASDRAPTGPGRHVTRSARTASTHCPKVCARTATPVDTTATSVTPGIARTCARLSTVDTRPLVVGGRHTVVGFAPGASRSIVNRLRPVTASSASTRVQGVPMTR
ncbi:hypothetical protein, partial [Actinosynnema sp.]|uniref:hypothetical protein n=1 Tax=Actinosynnema sp. TaxID=1872144 RepID=UPI003F84CBC8